MVGTTVVGSYPRIGDRPEEQSLRRAIARFDKGEIDAAQLRTAEREVVKAVLREQNEAGIDANARAEELSLEDFARLNAECRMQNAE